MNKRNCDRCKTKIKNSGYFKCKKTGESHCKDCVFGGFMKEKVKKMISIPEDEYNELNRTINILIKKCKRSLRIRGKKDKRIEELQIQIIKLGGSITP